MKDLTGPIEKVVVIPIGMDCSDPFPRFVIGRAHSQGDVTCRLCKQQYRDHIDFDGIKICPWPEDYPKPTSQDRIL